MEYIIDLILQKLEEGISKADVKNYLFGIPSEMGDNLSNSGAICVGPMATDITPETTGVRDRDDNDIEIVVVKNFKTMQYRDAESEGAMRFLTRIIDGRNADGSRKTDSIVYILRNNMRTFGIRQPSISINYRDNRYDKEGVVTASLRLRQEAISNQPII